MKKSYQAHFPTYFHERIESKLHKIVLAKSFESSSSFFPSLLKNHVMMSSGNLTFGFLKRLVINSSGQHFNKTQLNQKLLENFTKRHINAILTHMFHFFVMTLFHHHHR